MRVHAVARHAFALIMGMVCVYIYFMRGIDFWPEWMTVPYRLTVISAVLFLLCRLLGRLSLGLMLSFCAPVSLLMLLFLTGEGLMGPKLEPFLAVFAGGFASLLSTCALDWLLERARKPQHGQEI